MVFSTKRNSAGPRRRILENPCELLTWHLPNIAGHADPLISPGVEDGNFAVEMRVSALETVANRAWDGADAGETYEPGSMGMDSICLRG